MMRGNRLPALSVVLESFGAPRPVSSTLLRWTARSDGCSCVLKRDRCQALVVPRAHPSIPHAHIEAAHGCHEGLLDPEIKVPLRKSG